MAHTVLCFLGKGVNIHILVVVTLTTDCSGSGINWIGHSTILTTGSFLCEQLKCFSTDLLCFLYVLPVCG